jgi:glycosyltransferase involved in cell wall biosynthesis
MNLDRTQKITILHYSAPPVIGGVEAVIRAHLDLFIDAGYTTKVIAGRGDASALPEETEFVSIPEIDSNHEKILSISRQLEIGEIPKEFSSIVGELYKRLLPELKDADHLITHNVLTKHFNLPLTGALVKLADENLVQHPISWSHDFTWTSPSSGHKVHPGYPWDLLRTRQPSWEYVVVSKERQETLATLFACSLEEIEVVYNGVAPETLLGLSSQGKQLADRFQLIERDLILLMPVRVTKAKNIEFALHVLAELKNVFTSPLLLVTGPPDPHDTHSMEYYQSLQEIREELGLTTNMRFIFESGSDPTKSFYIDEHTVGDLLRLSDVMFMPSHREGFGMPVLEAGLAGIPVVSRPVPAAKELAQNEAIIFEEDFTPAQTAALIVDLIKQSPTVLLKRKIRQQFTWQAIFDRKIQPLLQRKVKY